MFRVPLKDVYYTIYQNLLDKIVENENIIIEEGDNFVKQTINIDNLYLRKHIQYNNIYDLYNEENEKYYYIKFVVKEPKLKKLKLIGKELEKIKEGYLYRLYYKKTNHTFILFKKTGILKFNNQFINFNNFFKLTNTGFFKSKDYKMILLNKNYLEWCDKIFPEIYMGSLPISNTLLNNCTNFQKFINKINTIDKPISFKYFKNKNINEILDIIFILPFFKNPFLLLEDFKDKSFFISQELNDTLKMSQDLGLKINYTTNSANINIQHNKVLIEYLKIAKTENIYISSYFKDFIQYIKENYDFIEIIDDGKKLLYEGLIQRHCVNTYFTKINQGKCIILSLLFNNNRYTCEVIPFSDKFICNQVRGRFNASPPNEVYYLIEKIMIDFNKKNLDENGFVKKKCLYNGA